MPYGQSGGGQPPQEDEDVVGCEYAESDVSVEISRPSGKPPQRSRNIHQPIIGYTSIQGLQEGRLRADEGGLECPEI